jgi:hypothetical protein
MKKRQAVMIADSPNIPVLNVSCLPNRIERDDIPEEKDLTRTDRSHGRRNFF